MHVTFFTFIIFHLCCYVWISNPTEGDCSYSFKIHVLKALKSHLLQILWTWIQNGFYLYVFANKEYSGFVIGQITQFMRKIQGNTCKC